ncbi:hypothetical protein BU24DRAFT_427314 [Aaosphaeria arxii CBS 175.79]|uniref:F-box domain-containing protein n=1 Tax=Aaosphaeria arxii CBS 175.79 TaxID=1450172 RepID=A0A6A5XE90_9PLEO|nr:uncharacterized protein BU24DRAFT_427314 [Aaosphaeria arxii CBS 175.79]KAF2011107.1 hypothetical protein BU24DRAFT_427314 [Aaosphaeria arxii CBS 175.79]
MSTPDAPVFSPFTRLPVELQRHVSSYLDFESLKALRLVRKDVASSATDALFRVVNLLPTEQSPERFNHVLEDEDLKTRVRKVTVNTTLTPWARPGWDTSRPEEARDIYDPDLKPWKKALAKIGRFPNVTHAELMFSVECTDDSGYYGYWSKEVGDTQDFRVAVLEKFFKALNREDCPAATEGKLDTLTLVNFQDGTSEAFLESNEDFKSVRARIRKLHLQIATETDDASPENSMSIIGRHHFFGNYLRKYFLEPMRENLTHLSIFANDYWGMYPHCDLTGLKLPRLKSLAFGNWSIAYEHQIEWVIAHGDTLEELVLDDCPIVHTARMDVAIADNRWPAPRGGTGRGGDFDSDRYMFPSMRWGALFRRFQTELLRLRRFAIGHGNWDNDRAFEERYELPAKLEKTRYIVFNYGIGPSAWLEYSGRSWEDYGHWRDCEQIREHEEDTKYPDPTGEKEQGALDELLQGLGRS